LAADVLEELGDCCASCPITNSIVAIVVMELVNGGHAQIGIVRGNPGVFQLNPYPTPVKPLPLSRVRVLEGLGKGF